MSNIDESAPNERHKGTAPFPSDEYVSVVMPIYNHEQTVAEAIESVLEQVVPFNIVLHCLDDASVDRSAEIVKEYAARYPDRIRIYTSRTNQGSAKRSIYHNEPKVVGRYWCLLAGDDFWTNKNKLARQVALLDADPGAVGCSCNTESVNELTGERTLIEPERNSWNLLDLLVMGDTYSFYAHPSGILWRNIFLDRGFFLPSSFRNELARGDVVLMHMMLAEGGKLRNIQETMSCYRVTGRGVWSSRSIEEQNGLNDKLLETIKMLTPSKYRIYMRLAVLRQRSTMLKALIPGPINE